MIVISNGLKRQIKTGFNLDSIERDSICSTNKA